MFCECELSDNNVFDLKRRVEEEKNEKKRKKRIKNYKLHLTVLATL